MTAQLQILVEDGAVLAALFDAGQPTDLLAERLDAPSLVGTIFRARVLRADAKAGVAFLDLGQDRAGFLPLRAGARPDDGQALLVQVTTDARDDKGPALTSDLAIPGRHLVHVPRSPGVAGGAATRRRWQGRLAGGWIVRRRAANAADDIVLAEAERLTALALRLAAEANGPSGPLAAGPTVAERLILDGPTIDDMLIEGTLPYQGRLRPAYDLDAPTPRKGRSDIGDLLPGLLAREVALPAGGRITIEATRALTAIDVDAGAARDSVLANREAATAIARQLRLRNVGGLVAVDFIGLRTEAERVALLRHFGAALERDPARITLSPRISPLGLAELSRERRGRSLAEVVGRG